MLSAPLIERSYPRVMHTEAYRQKGCREAAVETRKQGSRNRLPLSREENMKISWTDGSWISVSTRGREVTISANREGLLSLAGQLTALAEGEPGDHIHYDEGNSLEEGSLELIIERR